MSKKIEGGEDEKRPIVKVAFFKPKEAWYKLTVEERHEISDKILATYREVGVKVHFQCNCYWSNEEWLSFVVEEYTDVEAVKKLEDYIYMEIRWQRYFESKLYLGIQEPIETMLEMFVMPQI